MKARWQRGCLVVFLTFGLILAIAGALLLDGIRANRIFVSLPAQVADLGPIWLGDFCRDNVRHGRYPRGWCPANYTFTVVLRFGDRGSIHPLFEIPEP